MVCSENVKHLCSLNAAETIVDFCLSLPHLGVYIDRWSDVIKGSTIGLPSSNAEALALKQTIACLKEDILLAKRALGLPLLEPLTRRRLEQLSKISMGCFMVALSTATAHSILSAANPAPVKSLQASSTNVSSKSASNTSASAACNRDEEWESCAVSVVESAIEIYKTLLDFIQKSPRSERTLHQNFLYIAAWLLLSGLQSQLVHTSQVAGHFDSGFKMYRLLTLISTKIRLELRRVRQRRTR